MNADAFLKIQIQETAKEVSTRWDIFFYAMVRPLWLALTPHWLGLTSLWSALTPTGAAWTPFSVLRALLTDRMQSCVSD